MAGQTTLAFWQLLLVAIGPATLTALVAFGGPWLLEGRKQEAERKKKRAEKLEEFICTIYEHKHWLEVKNSITTFGGEGSVPLSPFAKVQAISNIYFPSLKGAVSLVAAKASVYELWMIKAAQKRLDKDANFADGYQQPYMEYFASLNVLLDEAGKLAPRL